MNGAKAEHGLELYRILIVDEDPGMARLWAALLQGPRRSVEVCETTHAALEFLVDNPVDVALINQQLPGSTTLVLGGKIQERYPRAQVIYFAAHRAEDPAAQFGVAEVRDPTPEPVPYGQILQLADYHVDP